MSQEFKPVAVNTFISLHLFERRDFSQSAERFKSLDSLGAGLNQVQYTADFMLDSAIGILAQAHGLDEGTTGGKEERMVVDGN